MVPAILEYGGHKVRSSDLFESDNPIAMTKKFLKGLKVNYSYILALLFSRGGHCLDSVFCAFLLFVTTTIQLGVAPKYLRDSIPPPLSASSLRLLRSLG